ncbi:MAG TPA: hypothetical protein PLG21_22210 [Anaerolineae bacterium]|nr:hypothetical protein [Anaerolineae bacterium]HPL30769.1 hypothetical protein [Anaerolineae bacterium]
MLELPRIEDWLQEVLAGDAALTALLAKHKDTGQCVYAYVAPQGAPMPFVVYSHQGSHDVRGVGPSRIMVSAVYQVKAVGPAASMGALTTAADRLDTLLQGASGTVVDGAVLACVREQPLSYVEVDSSTRYRHLGGLYRIAARAQESEPAPEPEPEEA